MHRARYCLGRTREVICPACLGMDAGPKPRALVTVILGVPSDKDIDFQGDKIASVIRL